MLDAIEDQGNLKPVDPDKHHVTLAFLGDVDEGWVEQAGQAVIAGCQGHHAQDGQAVGLGAFPKPGHASVLWAGIRGGDLGPLARDIRAQLGKRELPYDDRSFHAHLTLARFRSKVDLARLVHEHEDTVLGPFPMDTVHLYASTLTPDGPVYQTVETVTLEASA